MSARWCGMLLLACVAGLNACASSNPEPCPTGAGTPAIQFSLFFGTAIPGRGNLSEAEWQSFLDDTVSVSLPLGYTVLDASGAWQDPSGRRTRREGTKLLLAVLPDAPESLTAVNQVRTRYQARFHQQLVGMASQTVCAAF